MLDIDLNYDSESDNYSYEDVINIYLTMIRKTISIEKFYIIKQSKQSKLLFPFVNEMRDKLYQYYEKHLVGRLNKNADPFLSDFLDSMER